VETIAQLLILLVLSRAMGEIAVRLGQTAMVGELISGIVVAAVIGWVGGGIPFLADLATGEVIGFVAEAGIFFLVLMGGIEMKPRELATRSAGSLAIAGGGALVPLGCGFALAWAVLPASELKQGQALLVGVAMSITAIPVTVRLFDEIGLLHTRLGQTVVAAAIFDDIIGLFLLAVLLAIIHTGYVPDLSILAILLAKVAGFFAVTIGLGVHVYPRVQAGAGAMQAASIEFSALMGVALAYALAAELLGLHWIMGAFMAGLFFEPSRVGEAVYENMSVAVGGITTGFLAPLFLVWIGLQVDLGALVAIPGFLAALIAVSFLGKLLGAGVPAAVTGFSRREAASIGIAMNARGAVELIVVGIAAEAGLFAARDGAAPIVEYLFSALVLMGIVTTLVTPVLLRFTLPKPPG
jgi:Kef-type K+ transport system membrane component KefB